MEENEAFYVASTNSPTRLDRKKVRIVEKIKSTGEENEYNLYKIEEVPESKKEKTLVWSR